MKQRRKTPRDTQSKKVDHRLLKDNKIATEEVIVAISKVARQTVETTSKNTKMATNLRINHKATADRTKILTHGFISIIMTLVPFLRLPLSLQRLTCLNFPKRKKDLKLHQRMITTKL